MLTLGLGGLGHRGLGKCRSSCGTEIYLVDLAVYGQDLGDVHGCEDEHSKGGFVLIES